MPRLRRRRGILPVRRGARITSRSVAGSRQTFLTADGAGNWLVDGEPAAHLDGCLDVDLESSAVTNALPVHRRDGLITRLDRVRVVSHEFGYGVGDDMDFLLSKYARR